MKHEFTCRVYYEDTDLAGIVYYANYLKFIERARTEFIRTLGVDQNRVRAEQGVVFAVRRVEIDYLVPARFDDLLRVETRVRAVSGARVMLAQDIHCRDQVLVQAVVTLVSLAESGRPVRFPADIRRKLAQLCVPAGN
ncbi:MAG: tol-pal system-associated acyl-CoA thioesterase [Paracoccaceae bacterium]|nr:tol-pal system-associated acyl-CoA thioesterase [Paracoccaceae bacterium]